MISRARAALAAVGALRGPTACAEQAADPPPAPDVPAHGATLQPELEQLAQDMSVTGAVVQVPELGDWTPTIGTRTFRGTDPMWVDDHGRRVVVWTSLAPSPDSRDPAADMVRTIIGEMAS